jgi:serine/threonine protein phosphatase PrpC
MIEDLKFENEDSENNDNKEDNNYNLSKNNNLNYEEEEEENNNNDIIDIESKAIEYETVNSNYSIKQCNSVLEYSFREDQNISYCSLMEDKSKSIENFNNNKNQMLFQLFDGYKGEEISNFLHQNFTHIYKQYLEETKQNIPRSLVKTFKEIDEIIKKLPNIEGKSSTGTIIHIIWENKNKLMVYSGNVGNTKACLVSPAYVIKLSQDQETPESKNKKLKLKYKKNIKNNILKKMDLDEENEKNSKIFGNYIINEEDEEIEYGHKKYFRNRNKKYNINKSEKSEKEIYCVPYIAKMEIDLSIKNQFLFLGSGGIWDKVDENELQQIIKNNKDTEQLCSIMVKNVLRRDTKHNISIFAIKLT